MPQFQHSSDWTSYYEAIVAINELLMGYFATFDRDFILYKRKKIQKIFEINHALYKYKNLSLDAELYVRQYMGDKKDEKVYKKSQLREDIKEFCSETDNFMQEGKAFVIYLDEKVREYQKFITK